MQGTQNSREIQSNVGSVISLINQNGGWTFHGWGKRSLINDTILLGSVDNKVF